MEAVEQLQSLDVHVVLTQLVGAAQELSKRDEEQSQCRADQGAIVAVEELAAGAVCPAGECSTVAFDVLNINTITTTYDTSTT